METEWAHTKQVPSTCHYCLGKSCQPRSMTHSGPNQGYPTNCSKLSNGECVLRKASVQTKNCPRKRRNDAVSWRVKQVQASGGIRALSHRGERKPRERQGVSGLRLLNGFCCHDKPQCAGASRSQRIHQQSRTNGRLLNTWLVLGNWFELSHLKDPQTGMPTDRHMFRF